MVNKMNKKLIINIIGTIFIFIIGFIIHNLYEWFPNILTGVFAPVNESIFEHIKMIFTSYIIWIVIKYFIYKKNDLIEKSFIFKELITTIFAIIIFLIIFLPIYNKFGENLPLTLFVYFISITASLIFNYFFAIKKESRILNIIGVISIILIYIITTYLTYNPIICDFFLDPTNNSYGLNK